jgi:hypothetical protein
MVALVDDDVFSRLIGWLAMALMGYSNVSNNFSRMNQS